MPEATVEHVTGILTTAAFESFMDLEEGQWFEAKGRAPYDLYAPSGRYELAKDVSSFANANGGHLIIGLITERLEQRQTDRVTALDLHDTSTFRTGQYEGILNTHIYPAVDGLAVQVFRKDKDAPLGLAAIYVPPQHPDRKPFLVTKVVEETEVQKAIVLCIARRIGASSEPLSFARLHDALRKGQDSLSQRLTRIEASLSTVVDVLTAEVIEPADESTIKARIDDILRVDP